MQNPADMWIMQEIITEIKPDFIIETGTLRGGSALYFATILKQVNNKGKVITVDIRPLVKRSLDRLKTNPSLYKRVQKIFNDYIYVITSNSIDPTLIAGLKELTEGKKVMVTLDSCHNYEYVLKELNLYSPLVSPGSYIIVQDTFLDEKEEWMKRYAHCPGYKLTGGPGKAVREFLEKNNDFTVDRAREKFLFTFYPSGYLQKAIEN
jgi:cephalosporin hydroxylase